MGASVEKEKKPFRWLSPLGLLLFVVGCSIITGDDDDDGVRSGSFYVLADTLNIRSHPTTAAPVIGRAERGMLVTATHQSGEWYGLTMTNGGIGWAHGSYLQPR